MTQRILIAEDHEEMRQLIVELLVAQGCEIREAADTQAVLDEIERDQPDLLILDVNMPGEGGIAALRSIREKRDLDRMRVLILSGSVDLATDWLTQVGADAHLPKPFPTDELNETVRRLLER